MNHELWKLSGVPQIDVKLGWSREMFSGRFDGHQPESLSSEEWEFLLPTLQRRGNPKKTDRGSDLLNSINAWELEADGEEWRWNKTRLRSNHSFLLYAGVWTSACKTDPHRRGNWTHLVSV